MTTQETDRLPSNEGIPEEALRFQRVMDIFLMAVDLDLPGREQVVLRECGQDATIAADVRAMLAAEPPRDASRGTEPDVPGVPGGSSSGELATGAGLQLGAHAAMAELRDLERDAAAALRTLPIISGHYRIIRTLGEGGMGVVYLAEQSMPKRFVALKAIRAGLASRSVLTRFVREANILGRLQHPGIAQIYECGVLEEDDSGRAFIVLEYVNGPTITQYAKEHTLGETDKLALLAEVCDAVQHAHQRGVIHRDLKPGNILVERGADGQARPKVLDFGVAQLDDSAGAHGSLGGSLGHAVVGTPGYMSPEQLDGDPDGIDATSDVYALGVILYEMLAGRRAFDVAGKPLTEAARLVRIAPGRIDSLSRARRTDLETIIAKAMHTDRARRYASAAALSDDLHAVIERRPIAARRDSALYVLGRLADRHRVLVAMGLLLLAAGLALVVSSTMLAERNSRLAAQAQMARKTAELQSAKVQELNQQLSEELSSARIDRGRAESVAGRLRMAEESLWSEAIEHSESTAARWALAELYQRIPIMWTTQGPQDGTSLCATRVDGATRLVVGCGAGKLVVYDEQGRQLFETPSLGARVLAVVAVDGGRVVVGLQDGRAAVLTPAPDAQPEFLSVPAIDATAGSAGPMVLHARGIREACVSEDGRTFSLLGYDKSVSVWHIALAGGTPELVARVKPHGESLLTHALSPDGKALATYGADTPQPAANPTAFLRVTKLPDSPNAPCETVWSMARDYANALGRVVFTRWSPSGAPADTAIKLLITGRSSHISMVNTQTNQETVLPSRLSYAGLIAPQSIDSARVLLISEDVVQIGDLSTKQIERVFKQEGRVFCGVWISPQTYVTLNDAGVLRACSTTPQPALTRIDDFLGWCFSLAWSGDGEHLAIAPTDAFVAVHDTTGATRLGTIPTPSLRIRGMAWLRDADRLVLGCQDGKVRIASVSQRAVNHEFAATKSEIYGLAIDPTEQLVAVGQWNPVLRVLNLETGELVCELPKPERRVDDIAFSPNGRLMVCSGYTRHVQVWNVADWSAGEALETSATPWGVEFSRDGRMLLVSTYDGSVDVFDVEPTRSQGDRFRLRAHIRAHQRLIPALAISPDGSIFATGSEDGAVKVWDSRTLRNLFTTDLESGLVISVAFSPDGRRLGAATGGRLSAVLDLQAIFQPVDAQRAFQAARLRPTTADPAQVR